MIDFGPLVAGATAWAGSREFRSRTTDLVTVTPVPRWVARLTAWAATICWIEAAFRCLRRGDVLGRRAPGRLGRAAVVAGSGSCRGRGRVRGPGLRPGDAAAQPVHRAAGRVRRLHRPGPVVARRLRPAQHVVRRDPAGERAGADQVRHRRVLPVPARRVDRPADLLRRADPRGARRARPAAWFRRPRAAARRRGGHRGRSRGHRHRGRAGRNRPARGARDRDPRAARRGLRPADPVHPGLRGRPGSRCACTRRTGPSCRRWPPP